MNSRNPTKRLSGGNASVRSSSIRRKGGVYLINNLEPASRKSTQHENRSEIRVVEVEPSAVSELPTTLSIAKREKDN